jgi:2-oxoglutarate ferredoxin oxidoreductase subunit beta
VTDSSPYGVGETGWLGPQLDAREILKAAGATFLARHLSLDGLGSVDNVVRAIEYPGFSLVHFIYPCVTHFWAVSLVERNKGRVLRWFKELFTESSASAVPPASKETKGLFQPRTKLTRGVYYDAAGSRPEYARELKEWTRARCEGGS